MLIPASSALYYATLPEAGAGAAKPALRKLKLPDGAKVDAKLSPKSRFVSFIDEKSNIHVYDLATDS